MTKGERPIIDGRVCRF